ncbi:MAG: cytochrome c oxidase assembly protein [Methylococcales bacterium]|nr:cytochrome c oxidase assembly protein [Methylococcales bacterium]
MNNNDEIKAKNTRLVRKLLFIVIAMFGFGYALVPIYDVFCDLTGINGKTNTSAADETVYEIDKSREITIEFITSLNESAPILFESKLKKLKVHPGQYYTVNFYAENKTNQPMLARAIPSISPGLTAEYFIKTECFCFLEQTFKAKEGKMMPLRFVIDPELPDRYKTITLAYTFFDNTEASVKNKR